jgi:hypothetical protein
MEAIIESCGREQFKQRECDPLKRRRWVILWKLLGVPGDLISQPRVASRQIGYLERSDLLLLNVAKKHLPAAKK